jgi:SSS family solute:Na+ symporter
MQPSLSEWDYLLIAAYAATMLAIAWRVAQNQRTTDDFFVAGRSLSPWAAGISLLASTLSTITYLGLPAEMFRAGIGYLARELATVVTFFAVWFIIVPFFSQLRLTSAYEFLEHRFNYATRAVAAGLCLLLLVGWMAVAVVTAARALAQIVPWDVPWFFGRNQGAFRDADTQAMIVLIGGLCMIYTTLGGLRAVVWTDVAQFLIMLAGAVFSVLYVALHTRSTPADWWTVWQEYPYRDPTPWFSWDVSQRSSLSFIILGMTFWMICTHGANQVALQRYFAVRDVHAARRSYLMSVVANLSLVLLLASLGYALMYFALKGETTIGDHLFSDDKTLRIAAQDALFPEFIRHHVPSGLRGLIVAALVAAAMSTLDSGANSMATIILTDFLRNTKQNQNTDSGSIRPVPLHAARLATALCCLLIVVAAWALYYVSKTTDIITLCQKGFNCYLGPLGGLFVLALFCRSASAPTVLPAVAVGVLVGVSTAYSREMLGFDFSTHLVIPSSCLTTILLGVLLSVLFGRVDPLRVRWTWRAVMRDGCPVVKANGDV